MLAAIFFLSFFIAGTLAQFDETGPCREWTPMENFNKIQLLGTWYWYGNYPRYDLRARCTHEVMTLNPDGTVKLVVKQLSVGENPDQVETITYNIDVEGPNYTFKYPVNPPVFNTTMVILNTDYVSYDVRGYCDTVGPLSRNYVFVETRLPHPPQDVLDKVNQVLEDLGVPVENFIQDDQTNCPYF